MKSNKVYIYVSDGPYRSCKHFELFNTDFETVWDPSVHLAIARLATT